MSFDSGGANPEDGITQKIISSLEARSLKAKIDNWVSLWKLLFPVDQVIPDPGSHLLSVSLVPVSNIEQSLFRSWKFSTSSQSRRTSS